MENTQIKVCSKGCNNVALSYHTYCKDCYNEYQKVYQLKARKKDNTIYGGKYIYWIVDKVTLEPVYIGSTLNFKARAKKHFHSLETCFAKHCIVNNIDRNDYKMIVLDLSDYEIIDTYDLMSIEHDMIYIYREQLCNDRFRTPLNAIERETLERVYAGIDIHHLKWWEFEDLIQRKKDLSLGEIRLKED